jgi:hypothetical protein
MVERADIVPTGDWCGGRENYLAGKLAWIARRRCCTEKRNRLWRLVSVGALMVGRIRIIRSRKWNRRFTERTLQERQKPWNGHHLPAI